MKKRTVLLLATTLITALALQACGGGNSGNNPGSNGGKNNTGSSEAPSSKPNNEKVTIKVWGDLGNQSVLEEPFKEMNALFASQHPDIKLEFDFAQNDQSLNVALQANELPDLFMVQGDKTSKMKEMQQNGFITDLSSFNIDLSRFSDAEKSYCMIDGKMYCSLPAFFDTNVVYYNKDLFEQHSLSVPGNWDEFLAVMETLKQAGVTPVALAGKSEWDRAWPVFAFAPALANSGLQKAMNGEAKLTDEPQLAVVFQTIRDFAEKGYFDKDFLATDGPGAQFAFTNGKAAMIIDGTWSNSTYSSSGINLGRFSVPNTDGKRVVQSSFSNFMTYAIASTSKNKEAAAEYLKFLNSQEAQQIMENHTGLVPTLKDITPKDEGVKELAQFDEAGLNIYSVLTALSTPESNTADVMMKEAIPKLLSLAITGEEAVQIIDKAATYPAK